MNTILIIDDEEDLVFFIKSALELHGRYRVLYSTDGKSGMEIARREKPKLILLDIMMPERAKERWRDHDNSRGYAHR